MAARPVEASKSAAVRVGWGSRSGHLFSIRPAPLPRPRKNIAKSSRAAGWVEHDPLEIWQATQKLVAQAIASAGAKPGDIASLGITNQRETTVVWNRKTGEPYCNAIVWQDTRTKALCDELGKDGGIDRFRSTTGLPLATYFSAPKLRWILDHVEGVRAAAKRGDAIFGTIDSWLIWNLTGGKHGGRHVTDVTNASQPCSLICNCCSGIRG